MKRLSIAIVLAALSFGAGCSKMDRADERSVAPTPAPSASCACPGPVVDEHLIAFLSKARAAHHEADLAEHAKDVGGAIRSLERLVRGPRPGGASPEVAEVTADTHARLADLRSASGDFDAAIKDVDDGLALATAPTHFRGHLFEMMGIVHERRMKSLADAGNQSGADREKKLAIEAYEKAMTTQDEVIRRALPAGEPPAPR